MRHASAYPPSPRVTALLLFCAVRFLAAQELETTLDPVTVTAARVEERASDVPESVAVVTADEMEARGAVTVAEAIETAAGVAISDYGAAGTQKTASIRGSTAGQVLVLIDGVRVSTAMSGFTDLASIPIGSIERIEVLRTGASALYGSDAVGGVVNIITKKTEAPFTVSVENGSFIPQGAVRGYGTAKTENGPDWASLVDSQKISFSAAPAIGDAVLRASGVFTRAANEYTFLDSADEVRLRQNEGLLSGHAALGLLLPLLGGMLDADLSALYKTGGVPGSLSSPTLYARQTDMRGSAALKYSTDRFFMDALDFDVKAHAQYADVAYADTETPADDSDSRLLTAGLEMQQTARPADAVLLVYGVSAAYDRGESTEFGAPERLSAGAFLAPEIRLGAFRLHPAARYDFYSDYAPGALSGSLGASWELSEADSLKLNLSRSYRVPSFEDLYWPSGAGVEGNPDLTPETGYGADVGYLRTTGDLSCSVSVFARYAEDVILWQYGTDGIWRPSNFGAAFYPGVESELDLRFLDRFTAKVAYTFLYSFTLDEGMSLADDKRLPMTPVHTASATLAYAEDGLTWSVTGRYQSLRYLKIANAAYLPEVFTLDAAWKKRFARGWDASVAVDNLFGAQYQSVSGYPMPNTSIRLGITAAF